MHERMSYIADIGPATEGVYLSELELACITEMSENDGICS